MRYLAFSFIVICITSLRSQKNSGSSGYIVKLNPSRKENLKLRNLREIEIVSKELGIYYITEDNIDFFKHQNGSDTYTIAENLILET